MWEPCQRNRDNSVILGSSTMQLNCSQYQTIVQHNAHRTLCRNFGNSLHACCWFCIHKAHCNWISITVSGDVHVLCAKINLTVLLIKIDNNKQYTFPDFSFFISRMSLAKSSSSSSSFVRGRLCALKSFCFFLFAFFSFDFDHATVFGCRHSSYVSSLLTRYHYGLKPGFHQNRKPG